MGASAGFFVRDDGLRAKSMRRYHYLMPARTANAGKPATSILAVDFDSPRETKLWRRRFFIQVASHTATQTYPAG